MCEGSQGYQCDGQYIVCRNPECSIRNQTIPVGAQGWQGPYPCPNCNVDTKQEDWLPKTRY
jgi:hypothetical protein